MSLLRRRRLLLLGDVPALPAPPAAPSWFWSPTDLQSPSDWAMTNPDAVTPRTMEVTGGSGMRLGRANQGFADNAGAMTWYVTIVALGGTNMGLGVATAAAALNNWIGADNNSIGYFTNGDVDINSITVNIGGYTVGDVVGNRLTRSGSTRTMEYNKNGGSWSTPRDITGLGTGMLYPAHFSRSVGDKYTANFAGLP